MAQHLVELGRIMKIHTMERETLISEPLTNVFPFFSKAENLQELTPTFLKFKILTPLPIEMRSGAIIEYRLQLMGIPFRWKTEITVWEPPTRFVDVQRQGPYSLWEHEHRFLARGDSTLMVDSLRYSVPGWIFEPLIWKLFVRSRVEQIFDFRETAIQEKFPVDPKKPPNI